MWWQPTETTANPLGVNIAGLNVLPRAANMEALLRNRGTSSTGISSSIFKNMPTTYSWPNDRLRGLVTSHSWSLDRISASPYIPFSPFNPTNGATTWSYGVTNGVYPTLTANPTPPQGLLSPLWSNVSPGGEFTLTFNSTLAQRVRVNLNRISSATYDYPTPDPKTGVIDLTVAANLNAFTWPTPAGSPPGALAVRVQLAQDIYNVLILVTGAQDPNSTSFTASVVPPSPQYLAARWLAQLAVNIVDYIDADDFITPFTWYVDPNGVNPSETVYGTEMPRLVVNEAYAQLDNNNMDAGLANGGMTATTYNLNVFAELHNPFKLTPATETWPADSGNVRLTTLDANGNQVAAYQLVIEQGPDVTLPSNLTNGGVSGTFCWVRRPLPSRSLMRLRGHWHRCQSSQPQTVRSQTGFSLSDRTRECKLSQCHVQRQHDFRQPTASDDC